MEVGYAPLHRLHLHRFSYTKLESFHGKSSFFILVWTFSIHM